MSTRVFAQTSLVDELKQNISSRASDIEQLEKEIAEYKIRIENVGNQKATLQNAVQTLDLSRAKLAKDIQLTQAKIDRAGGMITKLNDGISQKQQRIDRNKDLIADIIHRIDQTDSDTMLEILLSNTSLSSFLEDVDDMARMQNTVLP